MRPASASTSFYESFGRESPEPRNKSDKILRGMKINRYLVIFQLLNPDET
jgi:hypothetical protein